MASTASPTATSASVTTAAADAAAVADAVDAVSVDAAEPAAVAPVAATAARPGPGASTAFSDAVLEWYATHARDLPWRHPEASPWAVLVSEIMLQQTPVNRVLPAWQAWLDRWPAPSALAAEPAGEAVRMWGRLGYPRRALRLHQAAVAITEEHHGLVPDDLEHLLRLPGVGTYTARAVAAFAFRQRHAVIDVNVRRLVGRAVNGRDDQRTAVSRRDLELVESLLPHDAESAAQASAAFMELGALVCVARTPRCEACPLRWECAWRRAGSPAAADTGRRTQSYAGTDRQVRGKLLAVLRESPVPVPQDVLDTVWDEPVQRGRALHGLLDDGLVVAVAPGVYALPGEQVWPGVHSPSGG
ncbi:A/G-specific adenine glycosylase [Protofrankia sp. BMG5.30]|uniref:A/G-specific adenine glycosylase n=1 Tax=Protofrankia sp. BMG5.30 TaxID=1834514 RepID=UPI0009FAA74C|nr:A/G-specific adenine glycosylase [Protofrankia sp. BMG5.30]